MKKVNNSIYDGNNAKGKSKYFTTGNNSRTAQETAYRLQIRSRQTKHTGGYKCISVI